MWKIIANLNSPEEVIEVVCDSTESELLIVGTAKVLLAFYVSRLRPDEYSAQATFAFINQWQVLEGRRICAIEEGDPSYLGCFAGRVWKGKNIDLRTHSLPN